jgi:hypothetical protein
MKIGVGWDIPVMWTRVWGIPTMNSGVGRDIPVIRIESRE